MNPPAPAELLAPARVALPELGALRVHGRDATTFLNAQLTQLVQPATAPHGAVAAALLTPKGRMLGSFWMWQEDAPAAAAAGAAAASAVPLAAAGTATGPAAPSAPDVPAWWLVCSADVAAALARRLSMFVLRAKVRVEDAGATHRVLGRIGAPPASPATGAPGDAAAFVPLPAVALTGVTEPCERALAVVPRGGSGVGSGSDAATADTSASVSASVSAGADADAGVDADPDVDGSARWNLLDVLAGQPRIVAATVEAFVPQMVNFELVGGVHFRKGCYPGQEVVARLQYLGHQKRRLGLAAGAGPMPAPGDDVHTDGHAGPVGTVVNVAAVPEGLAPWLGTLAMPPSDVAPQWIISHSSTEADRTTPGNPVDPGAVAAVPAATAAPAAAAPAAVPAAASAVPAPADAAAAAADQPAGERPALSVDGRPLRRLPLPYEIPVSGPKRPR